MSYAKLDEKLFTGELSTRIRSHEPASERATIWAVAVYLIGCEARSMVGLYRMSYATMADDLGLPIDHLSIAVRSLIEYRFCTFDETYRVVFVRAAARHQWGDSPNTSKTTVKGLATSLPKIVSAVSKSSCYIDFCEEYAAKWADVFALSGVTDRYPIDHRSITDRSKVEGRREKREGRREKAEEECECPTKDVGPTRAKPPKWDSECGELLEYWNATGRPKMKFILGHARPRAVSMNSTNHGALVAALKAGHTVEDIKRAMENASNDAWLMGLRDASAKTDLPSAIKVRLTGINPYDSVAKLLEKDRPDDGFTNQMNMRRAEWARREM